MRGASNAVFGLADDIAARGVATHSSGNHAASLSYAVARRGIPCSLELNEQVPELHAVVAPIGGGGMISGTCLTLSTIAANIDIYAAEPDQLTMLTVVLKPDVSNPVLTGQG